jgi:hypothetical protein
MGVVIPLLVVWAADGSAERLPPRPDGRPVCVLFVGTDCPISNAYAAEIGRLTADYTGKVAVVVAYPDPDATPAAALRHAREFRLNLPVIPDPSLTLARRLKATTVPQAVLLDKSGRVAYRGRIDDRYPKPGGPRRENPTRRDLRDALDAVLAGRPVPAPETKPVGCPIPFR